jgi:phage shock protein PspC (stress-responsive transcriptional regulator)
LIKEERQLNPEIEGNQELSFPFGCKSKQKHVFFYVKSTKFTEMNRLKQFVEWHVFGVCASMGERMGVATSVIRKYFIYISFLTVGSPVIIYLFLAFWMNIKRYVRLSKRNPAGV